MILSVSSNGVTMELQPYQRDKEIGYPTLREFRANRRRYIGRIVKAIGVVALSGMGVFSFGGKKNRQETVDAGSLQSGKTTRLLGEPMPPKPNSSSHTVKKDSSCAKESKQAVPRQDGVARTPTSGEPQKKGAMKAPDPPPKKIGKVKAPDPVSVTTGDESAHHIGKVNMTHATAEETPGLRGKIAVPHSGTDSSKCTIDTTRKNDSSKKDVPPPTGGVPPVTKHPADDDTVMRRTQGKPMAPNPKVRPPLPGVPVPPKKPKPPVTPGSTGQ